MSGIWGSSAQARLCALGAFLFQTAHSVDVALPIYIHPRTHSHVGERCFSAALLVSARYEPIALVADLGHDYK